MALRSRLLSACARPALASSPRVLPAALARPPSFAGAPPPPHVPSLRRCLSSSAGLPLGSKPTMEDAKTMPREYYEMPNEVLLTLAANGDYGAMEERLIREIMAVDDVTWDEAQPKFKEARRSDASSIADTPFTHPPRVLPRSSFPAARTREAEERAKKRARRAAERS